jgi:hypothetical protein
MNKYNLILLISVLFSTAEGFSQTPETDGELAEWVKQNALNPSDYLVDRFQDYDIIFLAEDHAIKNNLEFVVSIIPDLYLACVYTFGMEFGAVEVQGRFGLINQR